jgi:hypothetical protein
MKTSAITMEMVKVGDTILGGEVYRFGRENWMHVYHVLNVGPMKLRFGKPNRILDIRIETTQGTIVDANTSRWFTQLI